MAVLDMVAGKRWAIASTSRNIPYLKAENVRDRHILLQQVEQDTYLMADDITPELLQRHHKLPNGTWKPGRMVVETSPGNFQVWIHAHRPLSLEEKRYWLKILKSDPGAGPCNRWGRCPGFRNRKKNIVIHPAIIPWQSSSGSTGNRQPTFHKYLSIYSDIQQAASENKTNNSEP